MALVYRKLRLAVDNREAESTILGIRYSFPKTLLASVAISHIAKGLALGVRPQADTLAVAIASGEYPEVIDHCLAIEKQNHIPNTDIWKIAYLVTEYFRALYNTLTDLFLITPFEIKKIELLELRGNLILVGIEDASYTNV